ncbi:MAG: hypothetical protein OEZ23_00375 [Gammaproteobacteria bacterium]|nr:hypothetical protein [Gammaproteobacteria bacterium]
MIDLEQTGLEAVDRFITSWNSRDAKKWAESLQFPHVRPSPFGPIEISPTAEDYISKVDFQRVIESGWDHSEWDYKRLVHLSNKKIHAVGQWSRYNKIGEVILTTPITYIVTCVNGNWGIQSRFGSDYAGDEDTSGFESRAFRHMDAFVNSVNNQNQEACRELLNYPHCVIHAGSIQMSGTPSEFRISEAKITVESMMALQSGIHSANLAMDINISDHQGIRSRQVVALITDRNGHLGIQSWSTLDPNETDEE